MARRSEEKQVVARMGDTNDDSVKYYVMTRDDDAEEIWARLMEMWKERESVIRGRPTL